MNDLDLIQKTETESELRLEWDYQNVRTERFVFWVLVLFWIIWAPITLFVTSMIFHSKDTLNTIFFCIWCIFGWAGTLGIPWSILQSFSCESIVVSKEEVVCARHGLLSLKPTRIPIGNIIEIGVGCYDESSDAETMVTLNIHYTKGSKRKRRHIFGYWLHRDLKQSVFCVLQEFADKRQIPLQFRRY